ncbi:MAG: formate dehydrogenase subunit delta [Caulobacteraceae bacterium]
MSEVEHAGPSTTEKLVYMANQIARFFKSQKGSTQALHTADHIKSFWTPHMLRDIYAHMDKTGGEGLDPISLEAILFLKSAPTGAVRSGLQAAGEHTSREPGNDAG